MVAYLRDVSPFILLMLLFGVFMTFMLIVLSVPRDAIVLLDVFLLLLLSAAVAVLFIKRSKFLNSLMVLSETIEAIEHFDDLMEDPSYFDEGIMRESVANLAKCAESQITDLRMESRANSQYIEQWIHEVKTPIATSKLILNHEHGEYADALKSELERIENLVEQALYAARASSLSRDYMIAEVRLFDLVGDACKSNMQLLTAKGIRLDIAIEGDLTVLADKSWTRFVLSQIIVNSAKYDASVITFSVDSSHKEGPSGQIVLEIADDGCGIPAQDVPRVFDRGFTGEVGRSHGSATGMGLFLAARMCSEMGIGITVASEDGKGTKVFLAFPQDDLRRKLFSKLTLS